MKRNKHLSAAMGIGSGKGGGKGGSFKERGDALQKQQSHTVSKQKGISQTKHTGMK